MAKGIRGIYLLLIMVLSGITTVFGQIDGMVLYWSFDTIIDNQFEEYLNAENGGTIYGCELVDGVKGKALEFDGINDYARIPGNGNTPPDTLSTLKVGSISLWFRVDFIPMGQGITPIFYYGANDACVNMFDASNQGLIIEVGHSPIHNNSKRLYFTIFHNECWMPSFCYDSRSPIEIGAWYHFVAIVDSNKNTGYLNGVEMLDRIYNFGQIGTSEFFADALKHENLWLGRGYWDGEEEYYDGAIDEIKIFNRALSGDEVDILYQEGDTSTSKLEIQNERNFVIYPNPADDHLFVKFKVYDEVEFDFEIRNILNQSIGSKGQLNQSNDINIKALKPGIYQIIVFQKEYQIGIQKFVKL